MDYRDIAPQQWLWLISTKTDIIYHCDEDWLMTNLSVDDLDGFRWTESVIVHVFNAGFMYGYLIIATSIGATELKKLFGIQC